MLTIWTLSYIYFMLTSGTLTLYICYTYIWDTYIVSFPRMYFGHLHDIFFMPIFWTLTLYQLAFFFLSEALP